MYRRVANLGIALIERERCVIVAEVYSLTSLNNEHPLMMLADLQRDSLQYSYVTFVHEYLNLDDATLRFDTCNKYHFSPQQVDYLVDGITVSLKLYLKK